MTTATGTFTSTPDVPLPGHHYDGYDVVCIDSSDLNVVFVDYLTDQEKVVIEKKLDTEDAHPKRTFGSAKEALDFLRSRIKRSDV